VKKTKMFTYIKKSPLSSYLQDYVDQMCEKEHKCQSCHEIHSITALKGLLISRAVRTNYFSWLFIFQRQYVGRERYRPTKSIVLVNEEYIDPDRLLCLNRLSSTLACFWNMKEMSDPKWEVYGRFERIEIGDKGVIIRSYYINKKEMDLLIDKIIGYEKEVD